MLTYSINLSTKDEILNHLYTCDTNFIPILSSRVDLEIFSNKIYKNTVRFEAWDGKLIGLISAYFNSPTKIGFINNVSIIESYTQLGIAKKLLADCINYAIANNFEKIQLDVRCKNEKALKLYSLYNFKICEKNNFNYKMELLLHKKKV